MLLVSKEKGKIRWSETTDLSEMISVYNDDFEALNLLHIDHSSF